MKSTTKNRAARRMTAPNHHLSSTILSTVGVLFGSLVAWPMKAFRLTGNYPVRKNTQDFCIDLIATDDIDARHRLYSAIGSRHRVQRRLINIEEVSEIDPTSSTAAVVIAHFRDTHDFSSRDEEE
ncbi:MAG: hypothetical protein CL977_00595 [Euryarchaeota archaeon]|nr:hypothetical protein [Euryarchaeota archaeon]